jgi:hypothetical protein
MLRRAVLLSLAAASFLPGSVPALESGYTFNRLVLWSESGEPYPRLDRDPQTGEISLLFLGPVPETGWDPVEAQRLVMHGPAFVLAEPLQILRPRDPDPDWDSVSTEASFDVNRDGKAEIVRARTVMIPDNRDPSGGQQRVLVEVREGALCLFGDLLEGPGGDAVSVRSISTADFTQDGYPDMLVRLESDGRGGMAFYSQAPLRYEGAATVIISGFSALAFHPERYGIFDLSRNPKDFLSRLPHGAKLSNNPRCATDPTATEGDGQSHCRYQFETPYLGWIREFRVDFIPSRQIVSFDLTFPTGASALRPEQALEFLVPVLGGGYRTEIRREQESAWRTWIWEGKGTTTKLSALESGGKNRAVSLRLQRN